MAELTETTDKQEEYVLTLSTVERLLATARREAYRKCLLLLKKHGYNIDVEYFLGVLGEEKK